MKQEEFNKIIETTWSAISKLLVEKGGEYAGDRDRLENFKRNGIQLQVPPELIWAVYYNKHHDAIMQYIQDVKNKKTRTRSEPLDGRIDDMINYLLLFKGLLIDRENSEVKL